MQEISQSKNPEEFLELPNSWEERGIRKGLEQGIAQGAAEAKKEVVLEMLKEGLSHEMISRVTHVDEETIQQLSKLI